MKELKGISKFLYDLSIKWGQFVYKHIWLYWILSFTWCLLTTIFSLLVGAILLCCGCKAEIYKNVFCIKVGKSWGGLELGLGFICGKTSTELLFNHEHGHIMGQITLWGPLYIPFIMIPSAIRYWVRNFSNKKELPPYDNVWFERAATDCGLNLNKGE